jgi:hypothetical protein
MLGMSGRADRSSGDGSSTTTTAWSRKLPPEPAVYYQKMRERNNEAR